MEQEAAEESGPPRPKRERAGSSQSNGTPPGASENTAGGMLPVSVTDGVGQHMVVSSSEELELMLANAESGDDLHGLERAADTLLEVAKRHDHLRERLREFAEWTLRVKRKLGCLFAQTDARGGDRAKWHDATLLPGNINPSAAKRLRKMGRIDEQQFLCYLERSRDLSIIPSSAGFLEFAQKGPAPRARPKRKGAQVKTASPEIEVPPQVLDALERCLGDIDVCVGGAKVKCRLRLTGAKHTPVSALGEHDRDSDLAKLLAFAHQQCVTIRGVRLADREDVAQEAVIAYWRARVAGAEIRAPRAFIVRAMRFLGGKAARAARHRRAEELSPESVETMGMATTDASAIAHLRECLPSNMQPWLDAAISHGGAVSNAARWKRASRLRAWILDHFLP